MDFDFQLISSSYLNTLGTVVCSNLFECEISTCSYKQFLIFLSQFQLSFCYLNSLQLALFHSIKYIIGKSVLFFFFFLTRTDYWKIRPC